MENLFFTVLGMSLTGSFVILFVLLARLVLKKAPKIFSYALWAVALFRLLCPFAIESAFSLLPSARMVSAAGRGGGTDQVIQVHTGIPALNSQVNDFLADHPYQEGQPVVAGGSPEEGLAPAVNQLGPAPDWRTLPAAVWLAGTAALLGYSLISLLLLRRRLAGSVPLAGEKRVRLAGGIPSPFVLGLFRPVVYLPSGLPEGELDYILLHERTHIRRFDHATRALAWLAAAVHWFNPLVWLAFHLAGRDMEMSCDEAVLSRMDRDVRADYSASLLRLSVGGRLPAGPLAFGGGELKGRIKNVLGYQKPAFWAAALALAGVVCLGAALATNPGGPADVPQPSGAPGESAFPSADGGLTFALVQTDDGRPYVRMDGAVLGRALRESIIWWPPYGDGEEQYAGYRGLTMEYIFESGWGRVYAWWADGERTSVALSTQASTLAVSSIVDWWEFTVDLSGERGKVTSMETTNQEGAQWTLPPAVTEEEAVDAARIAAKLLTAAEDYYRNCGESLSTTPAGEVGYTPEYGAGEFGECLVNGLGDAYVEWHAPRRGESVDWLYFAHDPAFFCPRLAGEAVEGGAQWTDKGRTAVRVNFNVNDARVVSGTICGFKIEFTVDLEEMAVTDTFTRSMVEGETLELSEDEMFYAAQVFADLLTGAEKYFYDGPPS